MSKRRTEAFARLEAARPANGDTPQTEQEWQTLQRAMIEFSYAMYRDQGASHEKAKSILELIHGGKLGRMLLEASFAGGDDE